MFIVNTPKKELYIFSGPKSYDNSEYKTIPSSFTITSNRVQAGSNLENYMDLVRSRPDDDGIGATARATCVVVSKCDYTKHTWCLTCFLWPVDALLRNDRVIVNDGTILSVSVFKVVESLRVQRTVHLDLKTWLKLRPLLEFSAIKSEIVLVWQ